MLKGANGFFLIWQFQQHLALYLNIQKLFEVNYNLDYHAGNPLKFAMLFFVAQYVHLYST